MKRTLTVVGILILLLLLLGGGACYFFFGKAVQGPVTATQLVPSSSPVFLWLPGVPQTVEHFKATPAYAMLKDQTVQAALQKLNPFQSATAPLPAPEEAKKVWDLAGPLWNSFQGEAFLAVTSIQADPEPKVEGIGGFQIGPDPAAFQSWVEKMKAAFPELKWQEKTHPAQTYYSAEVTRDKTTITLCAARWQDWVFVGAGESAFRQLLDRVHAAKADPALSLGGQASFKKLLSEQPEKFDTLAYINPAVFMDVARKALEKAAPEQLANLKIYESMDAIVLTSSIEGSLFRDRGNILVPKNKRPDYFPDKEVLRGSTARFTTGKTLVYSAQNIDLGRKLQQMRDGGPDRKKLMDDAIAKVNQALAGVSLDLEKDVLPKLGPEFGFILDWTQGKSFPDISLALEHKDQAMVKKLADFLAQIAGATGGGQLQIKNGDITGDPTYLFTFPMAPVAPAIWVGKDMLLLTLNGNGLESMVKATGSGVMETEPYKNLVKQSVIKKPAALAYIDTEQLVLFSHGALSNLMPMIGGMTGQPDLARSLPPVDNLKPYLGHWLMFNEADDDGFRTEGLYEKGHPLIYGAVGIALVSDLAKALAPLAAMAGGSHGAPADPSANPVKEPDQNGSEIDPNMVLQDLVDIDDAISTWAKEKNQAEGTVVAWNDLVSYLPENSQVATRVGLDPLGNAYVLGKTGPGQVSLSPETAKHFTGKVPENFWGKFQLQAAP